MDYIWYIVIASILLGVLLGWFIRRLVAESVFNDVKTLVRYFVAEAAPVFMVNIDQLTAKMIEVQKVLRPAQEKQAPLRCPEPSTSASFDPDVWIEDFSKKAAVPDEHREGLRTWFSMALIAGRNQAVDVSKIAAGVRKSKK